MAPSLLLGSICSGWRRPVNEGLPQKCRMETQRLVKNLKGKSESVILDAHSVLPDKVWPNMPDSAIQKRSQSLILAYKQLVASEWHWPHQNAAERGSRATHGNKIVAPTLKIRKSQQGASPRSCGLRGQSSKARRAQTQQSAQAGWLRLHSAADDNNKSCLHIRLGFHDLLLS